MVWKTNHWKTGAKEGNSIKLIKYVLTDWVMGACAVSTMAAWSMAVRTINACIYTVRVMSVVRMMVVMAKQPNPDYRDKTVYVSHTLISRFFNILRQSVLSRLSHNPHNSYENIWKYISLSLSLYWHWEHRHSPWTHIEEALVVLGHSMLVQWWWPWHACSASRDESTEIVKRLSVFEKHQRTWLKPISPVVEKVWEVAIQCQVSHVKE